MSASDFLEVSLGNHILREAAYDKPTVIAIALFITLPGEDNVGGVEPSAESYARVAYGPSDTLWTPPSPGVGYFSNAFSITFPKPLEDWTPDPEAPIIGYGVFDALTDGNLLMVELLANPKQVLAGNPAPEFSPGSVRITFD